MYAQLSSELLREGAECCASSDGPCFLSFIYDWFEYAILLYYCVYTLGAGER